MAPGKTRMSANQMREMRERLELRSERTRIFARPDPFAQLAQPSDDLPMGETSQEEHDEKIDPLQGTTRVLCALSVRRRVRY